MLLGKQVSEISHHPSTNAFFWNILRWRFVCEAIVLLSVGDSSFGRALFETLLLRMTFGPLEKMPHLKEVFWIMVRDSHLQFRCQSEATATGNNSLRPIWWAIMMMILDDSSFNLCTTPVHLIDISSICIVTRCSIELSSEYKYTNLFICKEKKASDYACSLSFWTELQNFLQWVKAMVFIQAESLQDGNLFGAHFPSLPSLLVLTYCFSSSSLTGHIQKLLCQRHEKHKIQ